MLSELWLNILYIKSKENWIALVFTKLVSKNEKEQFASNFHEPCSKHIRVDWKVATISKLGNISRSNLHFVNTLGKARYKTEQQC